MASQSYFKSSEIKSCKVKRGHFCIILLGNLVEEDLRCCSKYHARLTENEKIIHFLLRKKGDFAHFFRFWPWPLFLKSKLWYEAGILPRHNIQIKRPQRVKSSRRKGHLAFKGLYQNRNQMEHFFLKGGSIKQTLYFILQRKNSLCGSHILCRGSIWKPPMQ